MYAFNFIYYIRTFLVGTNYNFLKIRFDIEKLPNKNKRGRYVHCMAFSN